ncbi:MAG: DUF502 domain-containing protein [Thermoguttaceae bacterium]|jgi:uncharacterized membrane protein
MSTIPPTDRRGSSSYPFRKAVVRGLAMLVPPLLTVVIFVWVISTTRQYFLQPVNAGAREALAWMLSGEIRDDLTVSDPAKRTALADGRLYYQLDDGTFVPAGIYDRVRRSPGTEMLPQTGRAYISRYVDLTYLRPYYAVPCFLVVFILLLYLLGKFLAAGFGGFFWEGIERAINRVPLVRSVYSAVKQVTDFFLRERQVQFTRVVAVEYPRPGMWSIAFVTSEGLPDIRAAAAEPVLGIFIPTSPVPMGGYALIVRQREVIDLAISIDQAIQFIVSCGLVIPPPDLEKLQGRPPADGTEGTVAV